MRRLVAVQAGFVALALVACGKEPPPSAPPSTGGAERFHLGSHTRKVTTSSPEAQKAFDRGLILSFAFSHRAAEEEFRKAIAADPGCAAAWWGVALVNGPHIN